MTWEVLDQRDFDADSQFVHGAGGGFYPRAGFGLGDGFGDGHGNGWGHGCGSSKGWGAGYGSGYGMGNGTTWEW